MNCPNCGKRPVGLFPGFGFNGVSFKESVKGFFRCKNCGVILEQKKSNDVIPKFDSAYWIISFAFAFLIMALGSYSMELMQNFDISESTVIISILCIGIALIGFIDSYLKPKYWHIQQVDPEAKTDRSSKKLTATGWALLIVLLIVAGGSSWGLLQSNYLNQLPDFLLLMLIFGVSFSIIGTSIYIMARFSKSEI